ncbi:hypothetical protein ACHAQA_008666 [Verticillium albo-atrum]
MYQHIIRHRLSGRECRWKEWEELATALFLRNRDGTAWSQNFEQGIVPLFKGALQRRHQKLVKMGVYDVQTQTWPAWSQGFLSKDWDGELSNMSQEYGEALLLQQPEIRQDQKGDAAQTNVPLLTPPSAPGIPTQGSMNLCDPINSARMGDVAMTDEARVTLCMAIDETKDQIRRHAGNLFDQFHLIFRLTYGAGGHGGHEGAKELRQAHDKKQREVMRLSNLERQLDKQYQMLFGSKDGQRLTGLPVGRLWDLFLVGIPTG